MSMSRVVTYIDGFNLYFGLRDAGLKRYYWLDLVALSSTFLLPGQTLEHVHYFTARIRTTAPTWRMYNARVTTSTRSPRSPG